MQVTYISSRVNNTKNKPTRKNTLEYKINNRLCIIFYYTSYAYASQLKLLMKKTWVKILMKHRKAKKSKVIKSTQIPL